MRAVGQPDRGAGPRNLLHGDAMGEVAEPCPAPLLLDRDAKQPELAELRPQLPRKAVGAVDLGRVGRDLVLGKGPHRVAQHVDIAAEAEIETGKAVLDHRALHGLGRTRRRVHSIK